MIKLSQSIYLLVSRQRLGKIIINKTISSQRLSLTSPSSCSRGNSSHQRITSSESTRASVENIVMVSLISVLHFSN